MKNDSRNKIILNPHELFTLIYEILTIILD